MSSLYSLQYPNLISMDKAAMKCIKVSFKLANSVMAMTGIAILMYCVWMILVCIREYYKYPFSWFLWACIFTGIIFCSTACIGHVGADTKNNLLLSLYIGFMLFLILVESLITADICLNDKWDKDIPKDRTKRFDHFVDYVDDHSNNFKCLGVLIAFSQAFSFFLAIVLRAMRSNSHRKYEDEEAKLPFLDHQIQPPPPLPYAVGHPDPQYYPPPPYTHGYGYAPYVTGNEKGEYVAATVQAAPKSFINGPTS